MSPFMSRHWMSVLVILTLLLGTISSMVPGPAAQTATPPSQQSQAGPAPAPQGPPAPPATPPVTPATGEKQITGTIKESGFTQLAIALPPCKADAGSSAPGGGGDGDGQGRLGLFWVLQGG